MEFSTSGLNRTLLFDPQGSFVSSAYQSADYPLPGSNVTAPVFYDAYGLPVWTPQAPPTTYGALNYAITQPFQYKGQYGCFTDGASGLVYCQQRYYDPNTGRWTERDPSGLDGGVNVYAYCDRNPVTGVDPSGLDT